MYEKFRKLDNEIGNSLFVMNRQEFMSYLNGEKKKELGDFVKEFDNLGISYSKNIIKKFKENHEIKDQDGVVSAIMYTAGCYSVFYPIIIYIKYLNPLLVKIRNYFYLLFLSTTLLLISLLYILATINYNSIKILLFLIFPSLLGISISVLQGMKIWSETKKNFIEAKKLEKELKKY